METKLFHWLGREFVEIRAEGRAGVAADTATEELFRKFDDELQLHGLSLDNCVRVRVWGPDKGARTLATAARSKILTGTKKVASSSFISQQWFDSDAVAGLELLAMKPSTGSIGPAPGGIPTGAKLSLLSALRFAGIFLRFYVRSADPRRASTRDHPNLGQRLRRFGI